MPFSLDLSVQESKLTYGPLFVIAACGEDLELPAVHFLCGCSYHAHCFSSFSDNDSECPACLEKNKKILDIGKKSNFLRDIITETCNLYIYLGVAVK